MIDRQKEAPPKRHRRSRLLQRRKRKPTWTSIAFAVLIEGLIISHQREY
jgi:hypothetical protein